MPGGTVPGETVSGGAGIQRPEMRTGARKVAVRAARRVFALRPAIAVRRQLSCIWQRPGKQTHTVRRALHADGRGGPVDSGEECACRLFRQPQFESVRQESAIRLRLRMSGQARP